MHQIEDAADAVLSPGVVLEDVKDLRHLSHKLAGSAATFGFHRVTACAKRLEHSLDELISEGRLPDDDEKRLVRMLLAELEQATSSRTSDESVGDLEELEEAAGSGGAASAAAGAAGSVNGAMRPGAATGTAIAPGGDGDRRVVAILVRSDALAQSLHEQFSFYGFETHVLGSPDALEDTLCHGCHEALVMDIAFIADEPGVADRVHSAQESSSGRLHVVYLSERDDFAVRLLAVRTGGAAFFSLPVDSHRLVDTVDGLTSGGAGEPYHVLIVDDDIDQVSNHALILQRAGMITSVVSDPQHLFSVLIEAKPDLILMDMYMPGCSGPELASMIRQQEAFVSIPIVFLSIETDEDRQFQAVSRGGDGFLSKPIKPEHLVIAVANRVERIRSMRFFMERDSLTGLLNHTHLMQSLSTEVQRAERVGRPLCFAMIDIDHFKQVNDSYGHLTGDRVLKSLSRLLSERLRKTDVIGRYGGEEFGIVMFNVDAENATRILDRIRDDFSRAAHEAGEQQFSVTFSCGIASYPDYDGPGPISEAADRALYLAKERGRNQIVSL
jgi:diguanylate cyclase (GGDEF)-like protein